MEKKGNGYRKELLKKKGKIEKRKEKDKGEEREETKLIGVVSHWVVAVGDDAKSWRIFADAIRRCNATSCILIVEIRHCRPA